MNVELLTLGHELLDGRRIDTNAAWIGRLLAGYGLQVRFKQSTLDRKEDIVAAFRLALDRSDLILCTGGLGPTQDDITFESLAAALNLPLEYHPNIYQDIQKKYEKRGIPCPESNKRQAMIPQGAVTIPNERGTAPGCFVETNQKMIFCFPGVPSEMELMMNTYFVEKLQSRKAFQRMFHQGYSLSGVAEARVEEKIQQLGLDRRSDCTLHVAYTASSPMVDVTFSILPNKAGDETRIFKEIDSVFKQAFSDFLTRWEAKSVEQHIVDRFEKQKWTLSLAESMTGGMVTSAIVDVPGCSVMLNESVVCYSNESKVQRLGVSRQTLASRGAVSSECILEMAKGIRKNSHSTFGLAISGIAGPTGATERKPVGLTFFCWVGPKLEKDPSKAAEKKYVKSTDFVGRDVLNAAMLKEQGLIEEQIFRDDDSFVVIQAFRFSGDRKRNRMLATSRALIGLYSLMNQYKE